VSNTTMLPPIIIDGERAVYTHSMKYLGLYLDTALNWNEHIAVIKKKVLPIVWRFAQHRKYIDQYTAILYYTSLIRPHLEYACSVYFNISQSNIKTLEIIQNRCLKIIAKSHHLANAEILRNQLKIPSLANRRQYFFLCEFFKLF
jgi:hypothetical protein